MNETAATHYKQIIGLAGQAADDLRAWEHTRVDELDAAIATASRAASEAAQRENETLRHADRWWRMAADNISRLSWLDIGDAPEPIQTARGQWFDRYLEDVRTAYHELVQAVLQLSWRAR